MKLLYINKIKANVGWGFETFLDRSLHDLGIETICIDYQENAYNFAKSLLSIAEDFDAVLVQRGCGYLIPLEILTAINRPKFLLFTELVPRNIDQHYLLKSDLFEHIFFRSLPCIDAVLANGWRDKDRLSLFLSSINPSFHQPLDGIEKDIDVLFVGTLLPRRQRIIDELSQSFKIETGNAFGRDMVELINRAKIVLNIHGEDFLDTETRVYETLACQAFLLTERLSAENPFQSGVDLVEAADIEDLKVKIAYYLENQHERDTIAASGYTEVVHNHSFSERAKQIKQVIENYLPSESPTTEPFDRSLLQICSRQEFYAKTSDAFRFGSRRLLSSIKRRFL